MKNFGYVKLHRSLINNPIFAKDMNAMYIFITLLMLVDRNTGSYDSGRHKLSAYTGINATTCYKALKRLEKAGMCRLEVVKFGENGETKQKQGGNATETQEKQGGNARYTKITLVNWKKYQDGETQEKQGGNENETQEKRNVTLNKNKEERIENSNKRDIEKIFDHYIKTFNKNPNQTKLTPKRISKISDRIKETSVETVMSAITNVSHQPFYMGDNDRGWKADIDFITRNYEQIERFADNEEKVADIKDIKINWDKVK